jgi:transcriptional regulator with XRE-family HTH domain
MYETENQPPNNKVIKAIRKKLKLSQKEMARRLDTDDSWISKVERGQVTPDWLVKFAVLLKMLNDAGLTYEDVVMEFPEPISLAEESAKYNAVKE